MKKLLILVGILFFSISKSLGQYIFPPNVTSNTVWCDNRPYFLVFKEDFKGGMDPIWNTFVTFRGASPEGDNWSEARPTDIIDKNTNQAKIIYFDRNVNFDNDHLILSNYKEASVWQCDTCVNDAYWSKYTGGMIALPYNNKSLNNGRIDIRAWMSSHNYAHHAFFLWYGQHCNNEIDIMEAYGRQPHLPFNRTLRSKARGTYNTHEWNNGLIDNGCKNDPNATSFVRVEKHIAASDPIYSIWFWEQTFMRHAYGRNRYGYDNTDYRNFLWWQRKDIYKMDDWHTYSLVWDSSEVVFKMDNKEIAAIPKWYVQRQYPTVLSINRYPKCNEKSNVEFLFNIGFPWDKFSLSQLRIASGVAKEASTDGEGNLSNGHLGDVVVDYVHIYQKEESDIDYSVWSKWKDPCMADPNPVIEGQDWLCYGSSAQYKISSHQPGGYWEIPSGFTTSDPLTNGTITLTRTNGQMYTNAVLKYNYRKSSACPIQTVYFNLFCYRDGIEPATPFMIPLSDNLGKQSLFFFDNTDYIGLARSEDERKKYNWDLKFIYPDTTIFISKKGRFFEISNDLVVRYNSDHEEIPYDLKFDLTIDFPFEHETVNVTKHITNANYPTSIVPIPGDTSVQLYHAYINDIDSFNNEWNSMISKYLFFEYELEDSTYFEEIRNQLKADLLAPYIVEFQDGSIAPMISTKQYQNTAYLDIYPNPAHSQLQVNVSNVDLNNHQIRIYDMLGKTVYTSEIREYKTSIDLLSLSSGIYVVVFLENGNVIDRKRFIKE